MSIEPATRRRKAIRVPEHEVLELFLAARQPQRDCILVSDSPSIPEGTKVLSVHHNFFNRCFYFFITHPSFDDVPDGFLTPEEPNGGFIWKAIQLPKDDAVHAQFIAGGI